MGPIPSRVTRRIDCGRALAKPLTIQILRSPGLPCQRTSSQRPASPRAGSMPCTGTPPQALATSSETLTRDRPAGIAPKSICPVSSPFSTRSRPGPEAPYTSSGGLTKDIRVVSNMLATSKRYSTACAEVVPRRREPNRPRRTQRARGRGLISYLPAEAGQSTAFTIGLSRAQVLGKLSDLEGGQVLRALMHDLVRPMIDGKGLHLFLK